jgi:predicted nuclease of predicted toxin-antitoxin system
VKIRLLLDEDVHAELSHALRKRGFDVLHAQELNRKGKTDREQLEFATQENRCIFI